MRRESCRSRRRPHGRMAMNGVPRPSARPEAPSAPRATLDSKRARRVPGPVRCPAAETTAIEVPVTSIVGRGEPTYSRNSSLSGRAQPRGWAPGPCGRVPQTSDPCKAALSGSRGARRAAKWIDVNGLHHRRRWRPLVGHLPAAFGRPPARDLPPLSARACGRAVEHLDAALPAGCAVT